MYTNQCANALLTPLHCHSFSAFSALSLLSFPFVSGVRNQGTICGRAVHRSDLGLLENDEGGGEGGAAGAATGTNGGEGGGRYTVPLATLSFPSLFPFSLSYVNPRESYVIPFESFSFFLSFFLPSFLPFFLSFSFSSRGTGRAGAGGVAASRWRTARGRSGRRTGKDCI